jgi:DNA-directed RNA polymerase sigma subunit (sigma70/sigma32)
MKRAGASFERFVEGCIHLVEMALILHRSLNPREKRILEARASGVTVKELASLYGVTRYRIELVTKRAKAKIVAKIITHLVTPVT